ncbi:glucan endo-1,3-beta-glucosidase 7-like [Zingiber officinale]|uniref:glucan endo-1,3-beta-glucosidase 7-like n=1 Tax=Zingiber officinale TaxID=94328 RepID=UPI001C4B1CD6|nr:glucan endo-1,3-beta-glucosidase 7-like [Zingiber officinale]
MEKRHLLLLIFALFHTFPSALSQSFIGVNYGQVADNLPPPSVTAALLQSTTISKLRLYGVDPAVIQSFAGTNISLVIGVANADVASLASDPAAAASWVSANVFPYVGASSISIVSVGNEALDSGDSSLASNLLPAMQNLLYALSASTAASAVKVSTVHSMTVLSQSDPPSSGAFRPEFVDTLKGILSFLRDSGAPFMINPYPYFAYASDPRPETLAFCLFQSNPGRVDGGSKLAYTNMFDAQVDAVRSAINALGFPEVEIVVAETGWPYKGDPDEVGASVDNAKAFVGNLVAHLRSLTGTPLMPGRSVDTYLFSLYDEGLKPGPTSERSFGLYRADQTMNYDAGLAKSVSTSNAAASPPQSNATSDPTLQSPTAPPVGMTTGLTQPVGWCGPGATLQSAAEGGSLQPAVQCFSAVGSRVAIRLGHLFSCVALTLLMLTQ